MRTVIKGACPHDRPDTCAWLVELDLAMLPGVVFLPFNWWPENTRNGQSANALTPDGVSTYWTGSNALDAQVDVAYC